MKFVAPEKPSPPGGLIQNTPFWPDIDLTHYRQAMRQDGTVTDERLKQAALTAISETNAELVKYKEQQQQAGFSSLKDVPSEQIGAGSVLTYWYRTAVYCRTKANISERYADIDSTQSGARRAEDLSIVIDDLWRDAHWAVARLQGKNHITVEMI